jgi:hypothetical protein
MGFLSEGKKVEKLFGSMFTDVVYASKEDDIIEHWDLKILYRGEWKKFDIKGLKKKLRSDDGANENIHWVEITNVNGNDGWLYGKADYFVFELEDYWLIVDKIRLQKLITDKLINEFTIIPILYRLYGRKDRKDKLTLVKTIDLIYISEEIILKK